MQHRENPALNYYRVNDDLYLVDFPGYGYAKVSKTQRAAFGEMIERYLLSREELKLVLLIVDMRHPPSKDDISMYEWCSIITGQYAWSRPRQTKFENTPPEAC